jgi:phosphoglycerate dehydrogenase-like enzyme
MEGYLPSIPFLCQCGRVALRALWLDSENIRQKERRKKEMRIKKVSVIGLGTLGTHQLE